jgi:hypothetical protein
MSIPEHCTYLQLNQRVRTHSSCNGKSLSMEPQPKECRRSLFIEGRMEG